MSQREADAVSVVLLCFVVAGSLLLMMLLDAAPGAQ